MKEEKCPHNRKSSHSLGPWGTLEISEGNITKRKKNTTEFMQTAIISREAAQMLMATSHKWGLGTEAWATYMVLRVRTRLECPEDNLRGLM